MAAKKAARKKVVEESDVEVVLPLVGHEGPLEQLRRALARGRLGHAFLFVGPQGVGKFRAARHVAQGLLCEENPPTKLSPCGVCSSCRAVDAGVHPDFAIARKPADRNEIPIELVKDLCARLALKPARGRFKVCIMDDADDLNEESSNSFLKTLEEPPAGSLLLLVATSVETQLPTILSRCQVIHFEPLPIAQGVSLLNRLGGAREDEALSLIGLAEGSVGRALELMKPEWRDARQRLLAGLGQLPKGSVKLAADLQEFIDAASKESAPKRARAKTIIRLALAHFRSVLSLGVGGSQREAAETSALDLAQRLNADVVLDLMERTLQAEAQVERFLNQSLVMDCWIDDLAQRCAGAWFEPVGGAYL